MSRLPLALLPSLALLAACPGDDGVVTGEVTVELADRPSFTYAPTRCYSGERAGFFGVDLVEGAGDSPRITRVIEDPADGPLLRVNLPDEDASVLVTGEGCERWDFFVERENLRVNDIWSVRGRVDVLCEDAGGRVEAALEFSGCH